MQSVIISNTATSPQYIPTSHEQLFVLHLRTFKWIISFNLVEPLTCCGIIAKGRGFLPKVQQMELVVYEAYSLCNGFCRSYTEDEENIDYDEKSSFYLCL
jgi:hypothetical protein